MLNWKFEFKHMPLRFWEYGSMKVCFKFSGLFLNYVAKWCMATLVHACIIIIYNLV